MITDVVGKKTLNNFALDRVHLHNLSSEFHKTWTFKNESKHEWPETDISFVLQMFHNIQNKYAV